MQLATDLTDYAEGSLGLVEKASSFLNDRQRKMWSKGELVSYVNDAQSGLAAEINRLHREYFLTSATTDLVGGQAYYTLPVDLAKLIGVEVGDTVSDREPQNIVSVLINDRRFYEGLDAAANKADYRFFFVAGTSIRTMPEPGDSERKMRVHYVRRLAQLVANTDVSMIPEQHHVLLAMDAARLALIKTKQLNPQLEGMRAERFDAMVKELEKFTPTRDETVEPFFGSYGPYYWNPTGI